MPKKGWIGFLRWLALGSLLMFGPACASLPELNTHYRIPMPSGELKGKKILLVVEDKRKNKDLLANGAKGQFERFTGKVTFSIARPGEAGFRLGPYDAIGMLHEAFKRRLESEGIVLGSERDERLKKLVIQLEELSLDLDGRMWTGRMGYQALIMDDGRISSRETVSVQAERARILGRQGADEVMGDLVTDLVNRLNISRLFREAGV